MKIKNVALISTLELELEADLTLLTGETGAGKSILVDALTLLLGARASADIIRTGATSAAVEGLFESDQAASLLEPHGIPVEGPEVILRREIQAAGKGRATVNGALVPLAVLREVGSGLMTIHGQHDSQGLLNIESHILYVDRFAATEDRVASVGELFRDLRKVEADLATLRRDTRERERLREMLEFQAGEIEKAGLVSGEEETLRQEKLLQASAGRLATLSEEAYALLYEDEQAVIGRLGQVYKRVEDLAGIDPRFASHLESRATVRAQLEDLALFLRDYRERLSVSPVRLDEIEERLATIERLKRKYGASVDEVLAFAARCRKELGVLGDPEEHERRLEAERLAAAARYLEEAQELSRQRRAAARQIEKKVEAEMALLAMGRTRFQVAFTPEKPVTDPSETQGWTERGIETAEFLLSPNPGEELRALARIASGGELSRILLALNSVASVETAGKTLVFDEVDAGIGGAVAEVVGRKLKAISGRHQVLCVTHLPQIASLADQHYTIRKRVEGGRTSTEARRLSAEERVDEVARMLAGETITDSARRHARELVRQSSDK